MQINSIQNNNNFTGISFKPKKTKNVVKNTFWWQAENALNDNDRRYYLSLHLEAKGKTHYAKYKQADKHLDDGLDKVDTVRKFAKFVGRLIKMGHHKLLSAIYDADARDMYPRRYYPNGGMQTVEWKYKK